VKNITIQDDVNNFIVANPGIRWKDIKHYMEHVKKYNVATVESAIKRFKKESPHLYHPGQTQTEYNMGVVPMYEARTVYSKMSSQCDPHLGVATPLLNVATKNAESEGDLTVSERVPLGLPQNNSVGILPTNNVGVGVLPTNIVSRPPVGINFSDFVAGWGYPRYGGLFEFQEEIFDICWDFKFSMINLPRDHGKSIYLGFLSQWALENNWDILYLGWTDRRKEVSEFVYAYCVQQGIIASAKTKASSPYHFQILSGAKYDTYIITAKEVLGMHALGQTLDGQNRRLLIIIDDPIDETFREERHKEVKLETKWRSTLSNINPDKIIFTGTKKFEEDFFYFIKRIYKDTLYHYYRRTHLCTPNIADLDIYWGLLNHETTWSDLPQEKKESMLDVAMKHACFNPNIAVPDLRYIRGFPPTENLLCPERWTEEELIVKRAEVGEYWWHSEYEQNPHPITGEVWEELQYIKSMDGWDSYDMAMIIIDPATASEASKAGTPAEKKLKATSYTGLVIVLRHIIHNEFHVLYDLTDHYEFEEKLQTIESFYRLLRQKSETMKVRVVIEKQGGGDDIISSATARKEYTFSGHIIEVHQTRDKIMRIDDYLRVPIKKGKIKFHISLRHSELINEILNFPYSTKLDAIDALATGIKEFENFIMGLTNDDIKQLTERIRSRRLQRYEKDWVRKNVTPWIKSTSPRARIGTRNEAKRRS